MKELDLKRVTVDENNVRVQIDGGVDWGRSREDGDRGGNGYGRGMEEVGVNRRVAALHPGSRGSGAWHCATPQSDEQQYVSFWLWQPIIASPHCDLITDTNGMIAMLG